MKLSPTLVATFLQVNSHLHRWWRVNREGDLDTEFMFAPRPPDARSIGPEFDPFMPYYTDQDHVTKDGFIHVYGNLKEVLAKVEQFFAKQLELPVL